MKVKNDGSMLRQRLMRFTAVGLCGAMIVGAVPGIPGYASTAYAADETVTLETVPDETVTVDTTLAEETVPPTDETVTPDDTPSADDTQTPDTPSADETVPPTDTIETPDDTQTPEPAVAQEQEIEVKTASKTYTAVWYEKQVWMYSEYVMGLKKKQTFRIGASAQTALSYKVTKGSKYVSVNKKGIVTVKKGTPAGTYQVQVTAKASDAYKKATKTVKITVESTPQLKNLNISWDLKNNKSVTYETSFCGVVDRPFFKSGKLTLKNYKVTKAAKTGYKQLTCNIVFDIPTDFTKSQIDSILRDYWDVGGGDFNDDASLGNYTYVTAVDYETGECLEKKNKHQVTVKFGKWIYSNNTTYNGTEDGNWIIYPRSITVPVTITYPDTYKNLCILAGGESESSNLGGNRSYSEDFFSGDITFINAFRLYGNKHMYQSSKRKVCHGIRVN